MRIEPSQENQTRDSAHPVHVLHVIGPAAVGGMEKVVRSLAWSQREAGRPVAIAAILDRPNPEHPFLADLAAADVPAHVVIAGGHGYLSEFRGVRQACLERRPGIVHTHGRRSDVVAGLVARRLGIPTVATVHGAIGGTLRNRVYMRIQHRALRRADAVVAVSDVIARKLVASGVDARKVHRIQNAFADATSRPPRAVARSALDLPDDAPVIGWVGRLSSEKGADVFLDAIAGLQDGNAVASVIGAGDELEGLQRRAERLGIAARVMWHGPVADAGRLFNAFDVFVLSSHTEGTPMVLLEAMAARTPIVATRVGGVPDVVSSSEALLVTPNDPAQLSAAIQSVLADTPAAASRADAAERRLRRDFGWERWVRAYDAIYRLAAGDRPPTTECR
jgi:glycosyltransferase involved in cell wall biosynthesis